MERYQDDIHWEIDSLRAKLAKCERERDEWEARARKLNQNCTAWAGRCQETEERAEKAEAECIRIFERCAEIAYTMPKLWSSKGYIVESSAKSMSVDISHDILALSEKWRKK